VYLAPDSLLYSEFDPYGLVPPDTGQLPVADVRLEPLSNVTVVAEVVAEEEVVPDEDVLEVWGLILTSLELPLSWLPT